MSVGSRTIYIDVYINHEESRHLVRFQRDSNRAGTIHQQQSGEQLARGSGAREREREGEREGEGERENVLGDRGSNRWERFHLDVDYS